MQYVVCVFILSTFVNGCLLIVCMKLCENKTNQLRFLLSLLISGTYTTICAVYVGSLFELLICRIAALTIIAWIAFGFKLKMISVYVILTFAIEGIVNSVEEGKGLITIISVVFVLLINYFVMNKSGAVKKYIPVELHTERSIIKLKALHDTGNMLCDPISGMPVLIVDLRISEQLTGLTRKQLQNPLDVMREPPIPGLRLIPFKTISQNNGFVLGTRIASVKIGNWRGSMVVAFAPEVFSNNGEFDALTGGMV